MGDNIYLEESVSCRMLALVESNESKFMQETVPTVAVFIEKGRGNMLFWEES